MVLCIYLKYTLIHDPEFHKEYIVKSHKYDIVFKSILKNNMNYHPVFIIAALLTVIIILIIKNNNLKYANLILYSNHEINIGAGEIGNKISIDINYFIRITDEDKYFDFSIDGQKRFLKKALRASDYGTDSFKEKEFRTLVRDRGFESVSIRSF